MTQPKPLVSQRAREEARKYLKQGVVAPSHPLVQLLARFEAETLASLSSETWAVRQTDPADWEHADASEYEVLRPDGEWEGVVAVDQADALDCVKTAWDSRMLASTPSPSDVIEKCAIMVETWDGPRCSASQLRVVLAAAIRQLASKEGQHHGQG